MLIVLSQDGAVRSWATEDGSGSDRWGSIVLAPTGDQQTATRWWAQVLRTLRVGEPLLLFAHGNDEEIGDETLAGWGWTVPQTVAVLSQAAPADWRGPLVVWACAEQISNFSTRLAVALGEAKVFDQMWLYGFNRALPVRKTFPDPTNLAKQADLQHAQVRF